VGRRLRFIADRPLVEVTARTIQGRFLLKPLVARVTEWPGAHCATALLTGQSPIGIWLDRTQEHAMKHRGEEVTDADVTTTHRLELSPLPCWRHLPAATVRRYVA